MSSRHILEMIEQARQAQQVYNTTHDVQLELRTDMDIRTEILDRTLDDSSPYYSLTEFCSSTNAYFNAPVATKLATELRTLGYEVDAPSPHELEWDD